MKEERQENELQKMYVRECPKSSDITLSSTKSLSGEIRDVELSDKASQRLLSIISKNRKIMGLS